MREKWLSLRCCVNSSIQLVHNKSSMRLGVLSKIVHTSNVFFRLYFQWTKSAQSLYITTNCHSTNKRRPWRSCLRRRTSYFHHQLLLSLWTWLCRLFRATAIRRRRRDSRDNRRRRPRRRSPRHWRCRRPTKDARRKSESRCLGDRINLST